jgi:hypothetical protein
VNKRQVGSVHVVVTIILIIVVIGLLGFIAYRQLSNKGSSESSTSATPSTQSTTDDKLSQNFSQTLNDRTITMKYPENWRVSTVADNSGDKGVDHQVRKTITSPDTNAVISVSLIDGGFGGACGASETPIVTSKVTDLPNGTGEVLWEYTINDTPKSGPVLMVIAKTTDKSKLAVGQDACAAQSSGGYFAEDGTGLQTTGSNPTLASVSLTTNGIDDKTLETARQIILSLKG